MTTKNDLERARKLALIAQVIAVHDERAANNHHPDNYAVDFLDDIADILGDTCSICRRRHGSEVEHAAE